MKSFERKKIETVGHPYGLLLLGCAVVGVVLILYSEASAEKPGGFPKTEHDAVKMEVQEQELDKLMLAKDVTIVPAGQNSASGRLQRKAALNFYLAYSRFLVKSVRLIYSHI